MVLLIKFENKENNIIAFNACLSGKTIKKEINFYEKKNSDHVGWGGRSKQMYRGIWGISGVLA